MAKGSLALTLIGLDKLLRRVSLATQDEVIRRSILQSSDNMIAWIRSNRLTGPRPRYLGVGTGRLRSSLSSIAPFKRGGAYIGGISTNVVYARIHELGGYAGRGRKVRIPARPYLSPAIENPRLKQDVLRIFLKNIKMRLATTK